jgi:peroxiredoxin Q/BCP
MSKEVGDSIPEFSLPIDGDGTLSSADLAGKKAIFYFYPKDNTSGCTKEACAFRDKMPDFSAVDAVVIGISADTASSHDKFKEKHDLNFPLIADTEKKLIEDFGVWVEKSMYGKKYFGIERATFLVDGSGVIRNVWRKVKVPGHADAVLEAAKAI